MEPRDDRNAPMPDWHAMAPDEVAAHWRVDPLQGLPAPEAQRRLGTWGPNSLARQPRSSLAQRWLAQLAQPLVLVLLLACGVTAALGKWADAAVILGVVLVNAAVGLLQEGKARSALDALARALAPQATVLRAGVQVRVDSAQLVPGDVVLLAAGDRVPADLRVVQARELLAGEAALTGESVPVAKQCGALARATAVPDRANMVFGGTLIAAGQGRGVVVATGPATQTGAIAELLAHTVALATPLTQRMDRFARVLLVAILALAVLAFAVGVWRGQGVFDMFMAAVALAVSAIPEGLPAAMTIVLAIGVKHMSRRRAVVRQLSAVETLGSTTVICTDKTGTLTENAMTVRRIWAGGRAYAVTGHGYAPTGGIDDAGTPAQVVGALRETLVAGALCNDASLVREGAVWSCTGDPTEAALLVAARKGGLHESTLAALLPRIDVLPFDPARRTMASLHQHGPGNLLYVKGAVEAVLPACAHMLDSRGARIAVDHSAVQAEARRMAEAGQRVLALAQRAMSRGVPAQASQLDTGLVLLGLFAMIDPPRAQALGAVRACKVAGIRVKMITGDHPGTATAIARQLGIGSAGVVAITGAELATVDDAALPAVASRTDVFARVDPAQKLRLVRALQAAGEVVAMTGDGVNDAPALKQADIGVAMGQGGTDVAKEAADIVLTDDNFATIEAAVEEGRGVWDNLVKFIVWTLPTNAGEGLVVLCAVLAGLQLPMTPLQILWNNMATALLLGMMLAFEPIEAGVMTRPPRRPDAPLLRRAYVVRICLVSAFAVGGAFWLFAFALNRGHPVAEARTATANLFVLTETLYLFNCRSLTAPFWRNGLLSNRWACMGALVMLAAQVAVTHVPSLGHLFGNAPIEPELWGAILALAFTSFAGVELHKWWDRRCAGS